MNYDFTLVDIVAHFCELSLVMGMVAIAKGHTFGWGLRLIGSAGWIGIAIVLADRGVFLSALILWPLLFCAIDIYGLTKWRE